jgi:hypothetical protein
MLRRAAQAPHRRRPLSSNVRPRGAPTHESSQFVGPGGALKVRLAKPALSWRWSALSSSWGRRQEPHAPVARPSLQGLFAFRWSMLHARSARHALRLVSCLLPSAPAAAARSLAQAWLAAKVLSFCRSAFCGSPSAQPRPNPSLERTATGKSPWPRGAVVHVAPRGQGAMPPSAAQLKR